MDETLILKNRLKEARAEKGLSHAPLAETEQFNPTAKLALILCVALDKKFEELFYF